MNIKKSLWALEKRMKNKGILKEMLRAELQWGKQFGIFVIIRN
jgi:hypothetical protein